jgi:hypothetical protein
MAKGNIKKKENPVKTPSACIIASSSIIRAQRERERHRQSDDEQRAGGTVLMDLAYPTQSIDGRFLPFLFLFI